MYGYKTAFNTARDKTLLLTLEIQEDGMTNWHRETIVDPMNAIYRASKIKTVKIEDAEGVEYQEAVPAYVPLDGFKYCVGEMVEVEEYIDDPSVTDGPGINFFLSKDAATSHVPGFIKNGTAHVYAHNGSLIADIPVVDGVWQVEDDVDDAPTVAPPAVAPPVEPPQVTLTEISTPAICPPRRCNIM